MKLVDGVKLASALERGLLWTMWLARRRVAICGQSGMPAMIDKNPGNVDS